MSEFVHVQLSVKNEVMQRWERYANFIGFKLSHLIQIAIFEFAHKYHLNELVDQPILDPIPTIEIVKKEVKKKVKFHCEFCDKIYASKEGLNTHQNLCNKNPNNVFMKRCQYCNKDFDPRGFATHEKSCKRKHTTQIPKDKMNRLRNEKKYDGAPRYGVAPGEIF